MAVPAPPVDLLDLGIDARNNQPNPTSTFSELYPDCDMQQIDSLEMTLSPTSGGVDMVVDALPHAWNMLCSLAGEGQLHTLEKTSAAADELRVTLMK